MRFDDRLQTLIDAPVAEPRDRAIRWRQIVDLLGRAVHLDEDGATARALAIVRDDAEQVDADVRAATLRAIAGRPLAIPLLTVLARQPLAVAAPLFAGRLMSAEDAETVFVGADPALRSLVRVAPEPPRAGTPSAPPPSIGAMVDRIEHLRNQRSRAPASAEPARESPAARAGGSGRLFEWESDPTGHIAWVDGVPRGAIVGRPLGGEGIALLDRQAEARIVQRHPFVDVPLSRAGMPEGEWSATGVPAFDPASGRFLGYRGTARRIDVSEDGLAAPLDRPSHDADSLRELVHEIKTPLNAIIGFAEIIDGQYLGPAHSRYRDRAALIVGQARKLLEAVEDLDFAASLRAGRHQGGGGCSLAELFPNLAGEIQERLAFKGAHLELDLDDGRHRCALSPMLAERLARRLLLGLCEFVSPGEAFRIAVSSGAGSALLLIGRPTALDEYDDRLLVDPAFDPAPSEETQGMGLGFALRLVRGLARVAGGDLAIDRHRVTMSLPLLVA